MRRTLLLLLAACGLQARVPLDAGFDAGEEAGTDGGADAGMLPDTHATIPVEPVTYAWTLRGRPEEYSIASAATGNTIVWLRYVFGSSGIVTTLRRGDGELLSTQPHDLAPLSITSLGDDVAFVGRGVSSISDWRVVWMNPGGTPGVRSQAMNLVNTGGIIAGAMFTGPGNERLVQTLGPRDSSGTHVRAVVHPDGGVTRAETPCGPASWWDAATAGDTHRFFIGAVHGQPCDLGNGQYVAPPSDTPFLFVLVRYSGDGDSAGGVPIVHPLPLGHNGLPGPAALGATADSVWVAYYSATSHLRLERFSASTVVEDVTAQTEATGAAFVAGETTLGLQVADVVPHPDRDRVYLLATVASSDATFKGETLPPLDRQTLAIFTFDRAAKLLSVSWVPSTNAPKSASSMMLSDDRLVVSGQCEVIPSGGTTDPLCHPLQTSTPTSFLFAIAAP